MQHGDLEYIQRESSNATPDTWQSFSRNRGISKICLDRLMSTSSRFRRRSQIATPTSPAPTLLPSPLGGARGRGQPNLGESGLRRDRRGAIGMMTRARGLRALSARCLPQRPQGWPHARRRSVVVRSDHRCAPTATRRSQTPMLAPHIVCAGGIAQPRAEGTCSEGSSPHSATATQRRAPGAGTRHASAPGGLFASCTSLDGAVKLRSTAARAAPNLLHSARGARRAPLGAYACTVYRNAQIKVCPDARKWSLFSDKVDHMEIG